MATRLVPNDFGEDLLLLSATLYNQSCRLAHLSVRRSMCLSVCLSVCPEDVLWKNGQLDLDDVWDGEWGRSRDGCIRLSLIHISEPTRPY